MNRRFKSDLTHKLNLKDPNKTWLSLILVFITLGKTSSQNITPINLKFQLQLGMILLIYPTVLILLWIFKTTLNLSSQNMKLWLRIHRFKFTPQKIKNRIVFKIKTGYKLELLTLETMKLLGSTKKTLIKIKMEKMCQNMNLLKLF